MAFLNISNVWMRYGEQVVLERINLQVDEGQFCTLVGASGCGKSTFLRLLLGQERPSKGSITLAGQPLAAEPDASRGIVFQKYSVLPHLTVLDNVALALELPLFSIRQMALCLKPLEKNLIFRKTNFTPTLSDYGNTVASTLPLALYTAKEEKKLQKGMKVLLAGFGVGNSWGATVINY